ncbi:MAG TPA: protein kinase [Thermoanaerobaculia bacterium]|nr:protein kinase [Thermoanaerobaculia bacterium]
MSIAPVSPVQWQQEVNQPDSPVRSHEPPAWPACGSSRGCAIFASTHRSEGVEADVERSISHYRLTATLGEGAMGVVYAAFDERLGRTVALKLIQQETADESARTRFWREARAAARVNHPNICQIYEIGEHEGEPFVAMELLEGEPLAARISRGPFALNEAIDLALGILDALGALHEAGIVHRDLKPSNVFLTRHGVKLLDFGLARPFASDAALPGGDLTVPGMIVGTPRYMAPEQWAGGPLAPAADLFACGALLFEMLTGRPAFDGDSLISLCHAVTREHPPALSGGPQVQTVDRIIHRALSKRPADRHPSAQEMARELRSARQNVDGTMVVSQVRTVTRLIVLPFRLLRPDEEIDFLSVSLPDAITSSLCGLESLVVRSSRLAENLATGADLKQIASAAEVDAVVSGTLIRAGNQVRLNTQLIEAPTGTILWSRTLQTPLDDIFQLQDELTSQVIESLAIPLSSREQNQLDRNAPADPVAYQLYLRATHVPITTTSTSLLIEARDLFRAAVDADPSFAPAWARLGRIHRVMSKYGHGDPEENLRRAEEAFRNALELNPDLALAHNYYTYFELEELGAAATALVRLLGCVARRISDPEIYAGLVTACRFCGLLDASVAADRQARRLDPNIRTSVAYTWFLAGELERAVESDHEEIRAVTISSWATVGREEDARGLLREVHTTAVEGAEVWTLRSLAAVFEQNREECARAAREMTESSFHDPEGWFVVVRNLARLGERDLALEVLERVIRRGFCVPDALERDPWLQPLRDDARLVPLLEEARKRHREAAGMFEAAGGPRLLGL